MLWIILTILASISHSATVTCAWTVQLNQALNVYVGNVSHWHLVTQVKRDTQRVTFTPPNDDTVFSLRLSDVSETIHVGVNIACRSSISAWNFQSNVQDWTIIRSLGRKINEFPTGFLDTGFQGPMETPVLKTKRTKGQSLNAWLPNVTWVDALMAPYTYPRDHYFVYRRLVLQSSESPTLGPSTNGPTGSPSLRMPSMTPTASPTTSRPSHSPTTSGPSTTPTVPTPMVSCCFDAIMELIAVFLDGVDVTSSIQTLSDSYLVDFNAPVTASVLAFHVKEFSEIKRVAVNFVCASDDSRWNITSHDVANKRVVLPMTLQQDAQDFPSAWNLVSFTGQDYPVEVFQRRREFTYDHCPNLSTWWLCGVDESIQSLYWHVGFRFLIV